MTTLVLSVCEAFRFISHPVVKEYRKQLSHKTKKVYQKIKQKVKKAFRAPKKCRVHCKNTPSPSPQCSTAAVQTSYQSVIQSLSHEGELDMSRHSVPEYKLNSNQNNNRGGVGRPVGPSGVFSSFGPNSQFNKPSNTILPNKPSIPSSKKSTSVGTSIYTDSSSTKKKSVPHQSRDSGYKSGSSAEKSLPKISSSTRARSPSPKTRRRSYSVDNESLTVPRYRPQPPPNPPVSPARQRRREHKATTLSSREPVVSKEPTKPLKGQVSLTNPPVEPVRSSSRSSLRRTASLSSIHAIVSDSSDIEDQLHSDNYWGFHRVPEFLKVNVPPHKAEDSTTSRKAVSSLPHASKTEKSTPSRKVDTSLLKSSPASKAEVTPASTTAVSTERRHTVCATVESSTYSRESSKALSRSDSHTSRIAALLRSLKLNLRSKKTQTANSGIEGALISGGIVGLTNIGNTCYMNSMLQCLSHTVEMTQEYLHSESMDKRTGLGKAYTRLMQDIWFSNNSSSSFSPFHSRSSLSRVLTPRDLKATLARIHPMFAGARQHDAQEFLRIFMSELHEEMKPPKKPDALSPIHGASGSADKGEEAWWSYFRFEDSPISRVFMGQLRSTLTCDVCKGASTTFDPFWDLALPLPKSSHGSRISILSSYTGVPLNTCLDLFTKEEIMDGDNKPYCASCGKCQRSRKQMTINKVPPVLVLYLKRFSGYAFRTKLETPVDIPTVLDLTEYTSKETVNGKCTGKRITYELYGISNHSGTVSFGHYTAVVKHYATDQWYLCNDKHTTKLHGLGEYLKSQQPYVLFYRRTLSKE